MHAMIKRSQIEQFNQKKTGFPFQASNKSELVASLHGKGSGKQKIDP